MLDFMQQAVALAATVDPHLTSPNPRVGCVVVYDGKIISQGAHQRCGESHAEALALSDVTSVDEIYITLEPCDHFTGKQTPSCTELIIKLKPKTVYVGALDPKFQGQNLEKIKSAGIEAHYLDSDACYALNPFLDKWHSDSPYPYVCLKIAQSLDGKITSPDKYITNEISRQKVHQLRAQYGAVLTSTETIEADDPLLDVRLAEGSNPEVVIVGTRELSLDQRVFSVEERSVFELRTHDLTKVLQDIKAEGIDSVLVEVGQTLNTAFLELELVDEIQVFIAPVFLGDSEKAAFKQELSLEKFQLVDQAKLGGDIWLKYLALNHQTDEGQSR